MFWGGFDLNTILGIPIAGKCQMPLINFSQFSEAEDFLPAGQIRGWELIPCNKPYTIRKLEWMGINSRDGL
jgi:hypothetical protein